MSSRRTILLSAVAAGATAAGIAVASGGPPPATPPDPAPQTVVAHGFGQKRVAEPDERTNRSVELAVRAAREDAIPRAVAHAREEAEALAAATGLRLGEPAGVGRDGGPPGWWESDTGRFGPGRWCGPIFRWRTVRGSGGETRRVRRSHHGCHKPPTVSVRVTVTFAAGR